MAAAEEALRALGFRELRVRHYGDLARMEFGTGDSSGPSPTGPGWSRRCKGAGYRYVTLDLEGLRSGNLNGHWWVPGRSARPQ